MKVVSPAKTMAIEGMPNTAKNGTSIDVNGTTVWQHGKAKKTANGLTFSKNTAH